ncbi:MAG TPA: NAD-dependent epimerase/dehydratase family protein, partial [Actinomycetospora sp.]|nr:NAD-dependent epimerase/dehydratase family protein [Actinomycetospora sp.]
GPEVRAMADLARTWARATGRRRPVLPLRLPGAIARGYREDAHLTPGHADGVVTFEQFLAARAGVRS